MNAALSVPARDDEVESKIRKIRAFGRNARIVTLLVGVWSGISVVVGVGVFVYFGFRPPSREAAPGDGVNAAPGDGVSVGEIFRVLDPLLTPLQSAVTVSLVIVAVGAIWLAALRQLYRLFANLAAGEIYTSDNVGCLRKLGLLWLLGTAFGVLIQAAVAVGSRLLDASVPLDLIDSSVSQLFWSFITAGLVLLASWIMDVGLCVKSKADALQRDAELTI